MTVYNVNILQQNASKQQLFNPNVSESHQILLLNDVPNSSYLVISQMGIMAHRLPQ